MVILMYTVSTEQHNTVTDILNRWSASDSSTLTGYIQLQLCAPLARFRGHLVTQDTIDEIAAADPDLAELRLDFPTSGTSDSYEAEAADSASNAYGDDEDQNYEDVVAPAGGD